MNTGRRNGPIRAESLTISFIYRIILNTMQKKKILQKLQKKLFKNTLSPSDTHRLPQVNTEHAALVQLIQYRTISIIVEKAERIIGDY